MFFTVAVPTYNRSRLLRRCLDSIKKQTFSDYEVLILDDCSSDDTPEVVKEYTEDERFRYIRFEKNHGFGDRIIKIAQDSGMFVGDWVGFVNDDDYMGSSNYLEKIYQKTLRDSGSNLAVVDFVFNYGGIEISNQDHHDFLPENFIYDELTVMQKKILDGKIKLFYKKDFFVENDFFNSEKQKKNDVFYEASYVDIYNKAKMFYLPGIKHVFSITPNARRKYLDFYNWIVSVGMVAHDTKDKELAYRHLYQNYTETSICLNAFFDWGGAELAKTLSYFVLDENFPKYLRDFAKIYKEKFQGKLYEYYNPFNATLMSENERKKAISSAKNIVVYGENSWREQIQQYLAKMGKKISYIADDNKSGYKNYQDILREKDFIDLVFISSGSPRVIYQMFSKLKPKENKIKVATLILRDEGWEQ